MDWNSLRKNNPELADFYASVAACRDRCPKITNCPATGYWPWGCYTEASPPVRVLAVLENPGPPTSTDKAVGKQFANNPEKLAERSFAITGEKMRAVMADPPGCLDDCRRGTRGPHLISLRGLIYILSKVLEVAPKDVYKYAAHTNAAKCSGPTGLRNQGKVVDGRNGLKEGGSTLLHCGEKFLSWELNHYRPKLVLAIARDAEWVLERLPSSIPFSYVHHPNSWYSPAVLRSLPDRLRAAREALLHAELG